MRLTLTFIFSFLSFLTLQLLGLDNIYTISLVVLVILVLVLYPLVYTSFFGTNIDKIEQFLLKNKKNPNFYIIYALANKRDEEVEDLTDKLLHKTKQESRQSMYRVVKALYFKDVNEAKSHVHLIKQETYRLYYQAGILLEEEDLEGASKVIDEMPHSPKWMKDALLAQLEQKRNNIPEAKKHANNAISQAKGLQRYVLYKTYEREFGQ